MSRHDDRVYLLHMRDYARDAINMTKGSARGDLDSDSKLRYALLHLICLIGEAASHLSSATRNAHPGVPWRNIIGMRNAVIHGYDVVDFDKLWDTVELELPVLKKQLDAILGDDGEN